MDNIKVDAYLPLCEQYNSLAQSFFQQHLYFKNESKQLGKSVDYFDNPIQALKQNECAIAMLQTAICAVVFEAFGIESYTNFFGAYRLGNSLYYSNYESGEKGKRYSTLCKIKMLCRDKFKSPYPTGGTHFTTLKSLFDKRDKLAHNKPKGYEFTVTESHCFDDYYEAMSELSFIYENLEKEMALYSEVKENLAAASGQQEPIAEWISNAQDAIAKSIANMIT